MIEKEIVTLLNKISKQLDDISSVQDEIKEEIQGLYSDLRSFQESTLKIIEDQTINPPANPLH